MLQDLSEYDHIALVAYDLLHVFLVSLQSQHRLWARPIGLVCTRDYLQSERKPTIELSQVL